MLIGRLHLAARLVLGAVFVLSGVLKLIWPHQAADLLSELSFLDPRICKILVIALSLLEMMIGVMLFVGKQYVQISALASSILLLFFTFMGVATIQNPRSCGCFGEVLDMKTDEYFVLRNIVLLLISMFVLRYSKTPNTTQVEDAP